MRRLPPLNALKAFEATARLSSVTAAAEELCVSHSAVSQQIRQLEAYLGQRLFDRPGRRVRPTPEAATLMADVQASFDRIVTATNRIKRRGAGRILSVNTSQAFAMRWLIPRIAGFQRKHESLELRIETSASEAVAHIDLACDLIVRSEIAMRPGYACRRLLDDCATPVLHPALNAQIGVREPRALSRMPLLHTRVNPDIWNRWFAQCGVTGVEAQTGPCFDDASVALQAASAGLGVAIAPLAFVAAELADGRLIAPFSKIITRGPGFHLLFRECAAEERGVRELLKWLEAETGARLLPASFGSLHS